MTTLKNIKLLEYKFLKNMWYNLFWSYSSAFLWTWMEVNDICKYNFWDNIKSIDWKTTAKKSELYVKKYIEERDLKVLFLVDISSSLDFWSDKITKFELLKNILFTLISCSINNNDNIWAIFYDKIIKKYINFKKGNTNLFKIFDYLDSLIQKEDSKDTLWVLKEIKRLKINKTLIFILTDDVEFNDEKILKLAWIENQIIVLNIFDYLEVNMEKNINLNIIKEKNYFWLNSIFSTDVDNYNNFVKTQIEKLKTKLQKNKIWYIYFDTKKNIYNELLNYFYNKTN